MSTACPLLTKVDNTFICKYLGKNVNPFMWYCLSDYFTCPHYIEYRRRGGITETKPEEKPSEVVSEVTPIVKTYEVEKVVRERFRSEIAEKNIAVVKEAYKEVKSE